jgi:hypothetical protein
MLSGLVDLKVVLTDGDGDKATDQIDLGSRIKFEDDGPAVNVGDATGTYALGAQGSWTDLPGTDGFGSLGVTFDKYQIDAHGLVVTGPANSTFVKTGDFSFDGSINDDFNGNGIKETVKFTLTFNPANDSYAIVVGTPPVETSTFNTTQGALKSGGPDAVQTLLFGGTPPQRSGKRRHRFLRRQPDREGDRCERLSQRHPRPGG